jgi:hypothetical protein
VRFTVESWAPEYGSPGDEAALAPPGDAVDLDAEVPRSRWAPRSAEVGTAAPEVVRVVDGVRRVDAWVWFADGEGGSRRGMCASYAAGVVACDTAATVVAAEVGRALFAPAGAEAVETAHGRYRHVPVASDDPDALSVALQAEMAGLEHQVSVAACAGEAGGDDLLVVDGPLRERHRLPGAVGFVKTHDRSYLTDPAAAAVIGRLGPGQRTPVFFLGGRFSRWSWYLRLPCEVTHAWAGVVRCEASRDLDVGQAAGLADRVAVALPRLASAPHKDPRAPQNLYPIGGLERALRRRLGDPALLYRALRTAAAA